jgi:hypothetical protein
LPATTCKASQDGRGVDGWLGKAERDLTLVVQGREVRSDG